MVRFAIWQCKKEPTEMHKNDTANDTLTPPYGTEIIEEA